VLFAGAGKASIVAGSDEMVNLFIALQNKKSSKPARKEASGHAYFILCVHLLLMQEKKQEIIAQMQEKQGWWISQKYNCVENQIYNIYHFWHISTL